MGFIGYVDIIICHSYLQLLCIVGFVGIAGIMWHPLSNTCSSTFILLELPTATWSQATSWWTRRVTELDCTEKPRIKWCWLWAIWFYLTCATQYFCSYLQLEYVSSIGIDIPACISVQPMHLPEPNLLVRTVPCESQTLVWLEAVPMLRPWLRLAGSWNCFDGFHLSHEK